MNIKKALQFIVKYSQPDARDIMQEIAGELTHHLNDLAEQLEAKDKVIEAAQEYIDVYYTGVHSIQKVNNLQRVLRKALAQYKELNNDT